MKLYCSLDAGAHVPVRKHITDAGLDIKACEDTLLLSYCVTKVRTGLHVVIPSHCVGLLTLRSGFSTRHNCSLVNGVGIIDNEFRGEILVPIVCNMPSARYLLKAGERFAQLVIVPCHFPTPCVVDSIPQTERGNGGFGSTGE